jgi:hypothetical protein
VFFTAPDYEKAKAVKIEALVQMGAEWPNEINQRYFANIIGPPRGGCKSIRHMFGYEEKPPAIQHAGTPLAKLSDDALSLSVGFLVAPLTTPDLCSLAKTLARVTLSPQAWRGCNVDTNGLKPTGSKSHRHYELWKQAKRIVNGSWACANVGLLVSSEFKIWRWATSEASPYIRTCGAIVCVSNTSVNGSATVETPVVDLMFGLATSKSPRQIVTAVQKGSRKLSFCGAVLKENKVTFIYNEKELSKAWIPNLPQQEKHFVTVNITNQGWEIQIDQTKAFFNLGPESPEVSLLRSDSLFCAAVMVEKRAVTPCWTIL